MYKYLLSFVVFGLFLYSNNSLGNDIYHKEVLPSVELNFDVLELLTKKDHLKDIPVAKRSISMNTISNSFPITNQIPLPKPNVIKSTPFYDISDLRKKINSSIISHDLEKAIKSINDSNFGKESPVKEDLPFLEKKLDDITNDMDREEESSKNIDSNENLSLLKKKLDTITDKMYETDLSKDKLKESSALIDNQESIDSKANIVNAKEKLPFLEQKSEKLASLGVEDVGAKNLESFKNSISEKEKGILEPFLLGIEFKYNDVSLTDPQKEKIDDFINNNVPNTDDSLNKHISIKSYVSFDGRSLNLLRRIALKRALLVRKEIVEKGFDGNHISVHAMDPKDKKNDQGLDIVKIHIDS